MSKIELLAPSGSLEKLKWACLYGCDAVYIGGKDYSLRANATNFSIDEIKKGVEYAHEHNVKVYVAVNIVFHNEDLSSLKTYLKKLEEINVDAIIFSDPSVMDIVNENNIKLELHLSTQASVLNKDAAKYYKNHNVKRIVLARECSKSDIKDIIASTNLDIECFVHGAMCCNISGRCVLSNYFTNRDANRGGCSQVCRFNFNLYDNNEKLISDKDNFSLAPKDLTLVYYLKELINMKVKSLKLEGRMRSIYYISTILSVYRKLIDMYENNSYDENLVKRQIRILNRCANRDVKDQFFNGDTTYLDQYYLEKREEDSNQDFLAVVLDYDKENKQVILQQRNNFKINDKVNIFTPSGNDYSFVIEYIIDENGNYIDKAPHPKQIVKVNCPFEIEKNSLMRVNFLD